LTHQSSKTWPKRAQEWAQAALFLDRSRPERLRLTALLASAEANLAQLRLQLDLELKPRLRELEIDNQKLLAETLVLRALVQEAKERQDHEIALIRAKDAAEQASRTKTAFLSSMSHEIRTPMTSVLGFAELLSHDNPSAEKRQNYIEKILRNSRHLLALIDNILDLSKIEAGHLVPHCLRFSPITELVQAVDLIRDQAEAKSLSLTLECLDPLPQTMVSDQLRFRQVLINLLGNAVKFTDSGGITVTVRMRQEHNCPMLEIAVKDTGIGIPAALQAALFLPFSQVSITGTRVRPGTGLGLTLARNIARSLGGDVCLTGSTEGAGSTFTVMLPLDISAQIAKTKHD